MNIARPIPPGEYVPTADQRVVLYGVPWSHYETQLALRGDVSAPRISFLDGAMELMSSSKEHERIKSYLGRLVETFALARDLELSPYGSWTLKRPLRQSGVEPDECYIVGSDQSRDRPDLAIEVIWTSGGIDKLEIYRRLGIPEVWVWQDGQLEIHVLRDDHHEPTRTSACLPGLDLDLLASFLDRPTAMQAVRAFRAALAGGS
ncbi:MAG TPA: Uma2 family endonuclease [Polyangia bacterium]|jgi:Uma2 family endonuclease